MINFILSIPFAALVAFITILVVLSIELGYLTGRTIHRLKGMEKEAPVSSISGYVLGLLAFIMAFSFGIVTDRYDTRKSLVLEEANTIRTTWYRTDFLPDSARTASRELLKEYVDVRLSLAKSGDLKNLQISLVQSLQIQKQLWDIIVYYSVRDMNSDQAALYAQSLNEMINMHESRVVVALHLRIPGGIWAILLFLVLLGMFLVGYQTAIATSGRSWANLILALSFSLVIAMIATLDHSKSTFIPVSQFPLENLLNYMNGSINSE